ncbi:alpha/beta hydrolase family protein [Alteromonas gilva]|uniref:Alpha/beta fold hydrolase n=1 Tax=Alteromonas gilva TaxID=2987522 RepID=A0ABT5L228_9ALTE|nr:alpha/beta fold hydrolase [Alteromonas gilva]MDC8829853.1 alpha/beta fold hydrolase [Alteromonas gilva]
MRTLYLMTVLTLLAGCQTATQSPTPVTESTRSNVPYSDIIAQPFEPATSSQSYGSSPLQTIYRWDASSAPKAVMVFVHGGCWLNAYDYTHAQGLLSALASQGVTALAIEYRRTGDEGGGWPGTLDDIQKALAVTRQWLEQAGPDGVPVSLVGHSAGGHLALLAAQHTTQQPNTAFFQRVIGLAAITDPVRYAAGTNSCQTATPGFFNGFPADVPQAYEKATPSVANIAMPVTLLQGTADSIVPVAQSHLPGANTIMVENAGHFDYLHANSHAFGRLVELLTQEK